MKRIFSILVFSICVGICHEASAQNADNVYLAPNPQTARWSYIETDSNGQQIATIYNSVESIEGDAVNGSIKLLVEEVPVASPKDTTRSFDFYCFKDGEFMADVFAGFDYNIFEGSLDIRVRDIIQEKYPDLSEEKKTKVLEEVKAELPNIKIMIMEPFVLEACSTEANWEYFKTETKKRAEMAKKIAEKYNLAFIPLQDGFDALAKKAPNNYWLGDGVHPTAKGHEFIKGEWLKAYFAL